jgi:hypothetical protein
MAAKPMILQEYEKLPASAQREVERFVRQLKKTSVMSMRGKRIKTDAKRQAASIRKWAGKVRGNGFIGRDHDKILYGKSE